MPNKEIEIPQSERGKYIIPGTTGNLNVFSPTYGDSQYDQYITAENIRNINDIRYASQTVPELIGNTIANFTGSFTSGVLGLGTIAVGIPEIIGGMAYDAGLAAFGEYDNVRGKDYNFFVNNFSKIYDNFWSQNVTDPLLEVTQENFPMYKSEERLKSLQEGKQFENLTLGEFLYDASAGLGYSASAWFTGSMLAKGFQILNSAKALTMGQKAVVGGAMGYSEAAMEGLDLKKEIVNRLTEERATGLNKLSDEEIEMKAKMGGLINFGVNLPIIGGTNLLTLGMWKPKINLGLTKYLPEFAKISGIAGKTPSTAINRALKTGIGNKVLRNTAYAVKHPFVKGAFNEGFQENTQNTSNQFIQDYISKNSDLNKENNFENVYESFKEILTTMVSDESLYNSLLGAVTGGFMGGVINTVTNEYSKEYKQHITNVNDQIEYIKNDKNINTIISDKLNSQSENYNRSKGYQEQAVQDYKNGDLMSGNDNRRQAVASWVKGHIENGSIEWIKEYVKSFKDITNPEEMKNIMGGLFDAYDHNPNNFEFKRSVDSLSKEINELENLYSTIKSTYKNPNSSKNKKKYLQFEKETGLLYAAAAANKDYNKRISSLKTELAKSNILLDVSLYEGLKTNAEKIKFVNDFITNAEKEIETLSKNTTVVDDDTTIDSLQQKVYDVAALLFKNDEAVEAFKEVKNNLPYLPEEITDNAEPILTRLINKLKEDNKKQGKKKKREEEEIEEEEEEIEEEEEEEEEVPGQGAKTKKSKKQKKVKKDKKQEKDPKKIIEILVADNTELDTKVSYTGNSTTDAKVSIFSTTINDEKGLSDIDPEVVTETKIRNKQLKELSKIKNITDKFLIRFISPNYATDEDKKLLRPVNIELDEKYKKDNPDSITILYIITDLEGNPIKTTEDGIITKDNNGFTIVGSIHRDNHVKKLAPAPLVLSYLENHYPDTAEKYSLEELKKLNKRSVIVNKLTFEKVYQLAAEEMKNRIFDLRKDIILSLSEDKKVFSKIENVSNGHVIDNEDNIVFSSNSKIVMAIEDINQVTSTILSIPLENETEAVYSYNGVKYSLDKGFLYLTVDNGLGLIKTTPVNISSEDADLVIDLLKAGIDPMSANNINGVPILFDPSDTANKKVPLINHFIKFGLAGKNKYQESYQMFIDWKKETIFFGKSNITFEELNSGDIKKIDSLKFFLTSVKRYSMPSTLINTIGEYNRPKTVIKTDTGYDIKYDTFSPLNASVNGFVKSLLQKGKLYTKAKSFKDIQVINRYLNYFPELMEKTSKTTTKKETKKETKKQPEAGNVGVVDVETKKAEIERRREEAKNKILEDHKDLVDLKGSSIEGKTKKIGYVTIYGKKRLFAKTEEELKKLIEAEYDAELDALEQPKVEEKSEELIKLRKSNNYDPLGFNEENVDSNKTEYTEVEISLNDFKNKEGIFTEESLKKAYNENKDFIDMTERKFLNNLKNQSQEQIKEKLLKLSCI